MQHGAPRASGSAQHPDDSRRGFLSKASSLGMAAGVAAAYGALGAMAARYLYPARPRTRGWMFVARASDLRLGAGIDYRTPSGERVTIARQAESGGVEDFVALSSTCPHLGCQVHWEPHNDRFFCPCHNGTFDRRGVATGGPPGDAGMSLPRYPLKLDGGLLYIEVPLEGLTFAGEARGARA